MSGCIFLYPGQGAWSRSTGLDPAGSPIVAATVAEASAALGEDVRSVCSVDVAQIDETRAAHVAIFVLSLAADRMARRDGWTPDLCIGHSLGEVVAAVAAGCLDFAGGVRLMRARGEAMADACRRHPGGMVAVRGLPLAEVEEWLAAAAPGVRIANVNGDDDVVVAGSWAQLKEFVQAARRRRVPTAALGVAGPFHSPWMAAAAQEFRKALDPLRFADPRVPVVCGSTGRTLREGAEVKEALAAAIEAPVRWDLVLRDPLRAGMTWIDLGPGRTLAGLVRRAHRQADIRCAAAGRLVVQGPGAVA